VPGGGTESPFAALARAHATLEDDPAGAAERAERAAERFGESGERVFAGRARLRAGTALARCGRRKAARAELARAAELFGECRAQGLYERTVREQRRVGVRTARPAAGTGSGSAAGGPLSRREAEVAELVRQGFTNQRIAERLFLSPRTVETHVAHVFAKLGVSSRAAVAGRLAEGGEGGAAGGEGGGGTGRGTGS
ncbi:response regulator transcription factor, partial [Streptomyces sp. NPDC057654]|uniref:helix-turn-helix transcriptional regulator n=1 Tax=Streptomyces sp. NPDC057654 TaxID=3346196 RepID=UPI0036C895A3